MLARSLGIALIIPAPRVEPAWGQGVEVTVSLLRPCVFILLENFYLFFVRCMCVCIYMYVHMYTDV